MHQVQKIGTKIDRVESSLNIKLSHEIESVGDSIEEEVQDIGSELIGQLISMNETLNCLKEAVRISGFLDLFILRFHTMKKITAFGSSIDKSYFLSFLYFYYVF